MFFTKVYSDEYQAIDKAEGYVHEGTQLIGEVNKPVDEINESEGSNRSFVIIAMLSLFAFGLSLATFDGGHLSSQLRK